MTDTPAKIMIFVKQRKSHVPVVYYVDCQLSTLVIDSHGHKHNFTNTVVIFTCVCCQKKCVVEKNWWLLY